MSSIKELQHFNFRNKTVRVFELKHKSGIKAVISNYGCVLMNLIIKDKQGHFRDVVLGFDSIEEYWNEAYLKNYPYFNAVIGRYANRIKGASFVLNGKKTQLSANTDENTLHGGFEGFDKKVWDVIEIKNEKDPTVTFRYISPAEEEGFPGTLTVKFTATLSADAFSYSMEALTDVLTPVNLSYHPYFNLDEKASSVNNQKAIIHAKQWLEQDDDFCLTGKFISTENSNYDFSKWKPVSQEWNKHDGFDQSFVVQKKNNELTMVAEAMSSDGNLHMQVLSTESIVHFYTGKGIPFLKGKNGIIYGPFSGYCFETHQYPNAVNIPAFPSTLLRPGEVHRQTTVYQFK